MSTPASPSAAQSITHEARGERSNSVNGGRPKGILKHSSNDVVKQSTLTWDEENINENEAQKTAKMKITEPKTPYVRYDAETDTVMNIDKIPGFELDQSEPPPISSASEAEGGGGSTPSSRRSSTNEKVVHVEIPKEFTAGDDSDSEMEDEEAREKRRQFAKMRGSHYKNEAEAMKRAAELMDEDDDEEMDEEDEDPEDENPNKKKSNGKVNGKQKIIPPVPPLPTNL